MSDFLAPELWPFVLAAALMVVLAVIEGAALLIGLSPSHWLDSSMPDIGHAEGFANAVVGWLHLGKVPVLVLVVIFLTAFSVTGFAVQFACGALIAHFLPTPAGVAIAFVGALGIVRSFGGALGKLVPKDETSAVSDANLVGRVGIIVMGTASTGRPAQARLHDEHGMAHYVMVEPEDADQRFDQGVSVLLVRRLSGRRFHAIHNPKPDLL
jgi:hypothetical protein